MTYDKQSNAWIYSVSSVTDLLTVIIPHFLKYPLLTQKAADFKLFVQIVQLLNEGAHLTETGLQKIVNIKASMNKGSSEFVKSNFSQINPVERETIETTENPDPPPKGGGLQDLLVEKVTLMQELEKLLKLEKKESI